MSNVISLKDRKKETKKEDRKDSFLEIAEKNNKNKERLAKERQDANKSLLRTLRMKK